MLIHLDASSTTPLYAQLVASLRRSISTGDVAAGDTLPSAADLAASLDLNRNTVLRAYRVAHKTGSIDHLANDCGIVCTDCGDYVLTLFYNGNLASEEEYEGSEWTAVGDRVLSGLSAQVYRIFTDHYRK